MHNQKLKILIITQNEPFYIPKMINYILSQQNSTYEISGITVLNPHRKNKNYFHWVKERLKIYSLYELIIVASLFVYTTLFSKLKKNSSFYNVKNVIKKNSIKEFESNDINSDEYVKSIINNEINLIISISCPQLFKENILNSVKYCINAHGTLLPRHRGVFGSWWTLFSDDSIGGSTIHTMELKLDAGEILWQKSFPLEKKDNQFSIAYKTKRDMAFGLVDVVKKLYNGQFHPIEPSHNSSYHRAPTKKQGREFHKKGYEVIGMKNIKNILQKEFN